MGKKLVIQAAGLGGTGLVCAYFFNLSTAQINLSTAQTISEILRTLGNISAISGSLVGWSVGWLSQSRTVVKDIDYDAAEDLFNDLGNLQKELIWRWVVVLVFSVLVIFCAILMRPSTPADIQSNWSYWVYCVGFSLAIVVGYIFCLFYRTIGLAKLKISLDDFELKNLRKKRHTPDPELIKLEELEKKMDDLTDAVNKLLAEEKSPQM